MRCYAQCTKRLLGTSVARRAILTKRPTSFQHSGLRNEATSFRGCEAKSFLRVQGTRGMRLKDANIAQIENVDLRVQAKYLSNQKVCMDQAAQRQERKWNNRESYGRWGKQAVVREMAQELAKSIERSKKQKEDAVRRKRYAVLV